MSDIAATTFNLTTIDASRFADQTFLQICHKLLAGEDLSAEDITFIKKLSKDDGKSINDNDIKELQQYLKISGRNNDTEGDEFDKTPFMGVSSELLGVKQENFKKELEAFQSRMLAVFGNQYRASSLGVNINKIIAAIPTNATPAAVDAFQKSVRNELKDRNNSNPKLDDLSAIELNLLARGTLDRVMIGDLLEDTPEASPRVKVTPNEEGINAWLEVDSTAQEWLAHLDTAQEELPATEQYKAEYLKRKMENLQELSSVDFNAMKSFLELKNRKLSNGEINASIKAFNSQVRELKHLKATDDLTGFSPRLKANILVQHTTLPKSIDEADKPILVEASRLLDRNGGYLAANKSLERLETIYSENNKTESVPLPSDPQDKKDFLKAYVSRIFNNEQTQAIKADKNHHSKVEPDVLYEDFQRQINFLESYVHNEAKSPAERQAIQDDLLRFVRGMEPSAKLVEAFGGKDKLKALNFMDRGYGNPRITAGMLKAIFTLPYQQGGEDKDVLNFNELVQNSNSFEELSVNFRNAIAASKLDNQDHRIPIDLLTDANDRDVFKLNNDLANLKSGMTKDDQGKPISNDEYEIFGQLDFDPSVVKFNPSDDDSTVGKHLQETSPKLYELLALLVDGDSEESKMEKVGNTIKMVMPKPDPEDTESKTTSDTLPNNGRAIASYLLNAVKKLDTEFNEYQNFTDASKRDFRTIVQSRKGLIEFSRKNNLNLYEKDKLTGFYHENEYEQFIKDFAMSLRHVEPMMNADKAFYKIPEELKVEYNMGSNSTTTSPAMPMANMSHKELQFISNWLQQIINANMDVANSAGGSIFHDIFGEEDDESTNDTYLKPLFNTPPSSSSDWTANARSLA